MRDLLKALDVLRRMEAFTRDAAPGELGTLRAEAFCARSAIEASLAVGERVEVIKT